MHCRTTTANPIALHICQDGYIRLTESELSCIPITHLYSGLHDTTHTLDDTPSLIGFTEWQSETIPPISIGWDWRLNKLRMPTRYEMDGLPFTNVQLLGPDSRDYSPEENLERIRAFIHTLNWVPVLTHSIQPLIEPADSRPTRNH
jgi:hypothetical protein